MPALRPAPRVSWGRKLKTVFLLAGLSTLAALLWRLDPARVWSHIKPVGAGFLAILAFQIFDHMLNALGWRLCFAAEDARHIPFWLLVKARVAGDGVNYLTPSASIAGEFIRPAMLGNVRPEDVKNAGVAAAKFSQALAQGLFIALGMLALTLLGKLDFLGAAQRAAGLGMACVTMILVLLALYVLTRGRPREETPIPEGGFAALRARMRATLLRHPGRFALATLFFTLGYGWGALEVMLICSFMGVPIDSLIALAVEILSNAVDSIMFFVPAKAGTQEAGKTAIFHGLGYPPSLGLAFGLIRHARELIWAGTGLILYALNRPAEARLEARPPEAPRPVPRPSLEAPLAPAD